MNKLLMMSVEFVLPSSPLRLAFTAFTFTSTFSGQGVVLLDSEAFNLKVHFYPVISDQNVVLSVPGLDGFGFPHPAVTCARPRCTTMDPRGFRRWVRRRRDLQQWRIHHCEWFHHERSKKPSCPISSSLGSVEGLHCQQDQLFWIRNIGTSDYSSKSNLCTSSYAKVTKLGHWKYCQWCTIGRPGPAV